MEEGGGVGWVLIVGVLLAVGVIYHAVDMDLFAHVHGEDEREPAGAEVGAGLDPAKHTQRHLFDSNNHLNKIIIHLYQDKNIHSVYRTCVTFACLSLLRL